MEKINKFLLMVISMVAIMITAVGIDKGMQLYNSRKWEKERVERYRQSYADATDMQLTISQLSEDPEAIEAFLEENRLYFDEVMDAELHEQVSMEEQVQETASFFEEQEELSDDEMENDPDNAGMGDISGNEVMDGESAFLEGQESVSYNGIGDVSENSLQDVSANMPGGISGNMQADISGNMPGGISGNMQADVSGNRMAKMGWITVSGNSLLDKRKIRGSYMETQMQEDIDTEIIKNSEIDFSEISIACLGDSITEATNLDKMEDYQQYAYPTKLKEILNAESITNLGIGGSSIGRYWDKAFVDRYQEIPQDTDLIIVMGGTNDGFCLNQEDFGSMEERAKNTFIGDLDELMRGLKENYPEATIVFSTPLPNVLHDMLRKDRDYLLPQVVIVNAIKKLAQEYEIPVIDLYNSNILDTHDAAVIYNYMPDGVHCNPAGYSLLAEHFAAEIIKLYEDKSAVEAKDADGTVGESQEEDEDADRTIEGSREEDEDADRIVRENREDVEDSDRTVRENREYAEDSDRAVGESREEDEDSDEDPEAERL